MLTYYLYAMKTSTNFQVKHYTAHHYRLRIFFISIRIDVQEKPIRVHCKNLRMNINEYLIQ